MRPALVAILLLLSVAVGAMAAPPKQAHFALDGVHYTYIAGVNRTGTVELNGVSRMPIESCAFVMLHDGTTNGRVHLHGLQSGITPLDVYIDQFKLDNGKRGYAFDKLVTEDGLATPASVAIAGNGSFKVDADKYYDPVSSSGIKDFDDELPQMGGVSVLLAQGVRDDDSKEVLAAPEKDDELHIHLRSAPGSSGVDRAYSFGSGGSLPLQPTESYNQSFTIPNPKLGGSATFSARATAYMGAGENELRFRVLSPSGQVVADFTLTPALLADDEGSATFPLDLLGDYLVVVQGKVSLATYTGDLVLKAPASFDLHFWYENVTYGRQAYDDYITCLDEIGSPNEVLGVDRVVGQPPPPTFNPWLGVVAVLGGISVVALGVKLAADQVAASSFRKAK
jgi:hypothetical protein